MAKMINKAEVLKLLREKKTTICVTAILAIAGVGCSRLPTPTPVAADTPPASPTTPVETPTALPTATPKSIPLIITDSYGTTGCFGDLVSVDSGDFKFQTYNGGLAIAQIDWNADVPVARKFRLDSAVIVVSNGQQRDVTIPNTHRYFLTAFGESTRFPNSGCTLAQVESEATNYSQAQLASGLLTIDRNLLNQQTTENRARVGVFLFDPNQLTLKTLIEPTHPEGLRAKDLAQRIFISTPPTKQKVHPEAPSPKATVTPTKAR